MIIFAFPLKILFNFTQKKMFIYDIIADLLEWGIFPSFAAIYPNAITLIEDEYPSESVTVQELPQPQMLSNWG